MTTAASLVSYGSSRYEKEPSASLEAHLGVAMADCLNRAGLDKSKVDGLALAAYGYEAGTVATLADHFGMTLLWGHEGAYGGASGVIAVAHAVRAVEAGEIQAALCLAGDAFTVASHDAALRRFSPAIRDWVEPHGFGGANGLFALVQSRHNHLHGTQRRQLGRLCVEQRKNALLNPKALFETPLTLEDYLEARPIAEPIHLFDCVMPCAGAEAVLVVNADLAKRCERIPVRLLGFGERHNARPLQTLPLQPGWDEFADQLFEEAGTSRQDIDMLQLYDDYPIMVGIQLESLGFCAIGGCGTYFESTDLSLLGGLPINTGGGQLSCGQAGAAGGMIGMTEAVQQLQHEGGRRQVPAARHALVSGFGLISYGKGLSVSAAILGTP